MVELALTEPEVQTLWAAARRASTAGLVGWWPFDGDAKDGSGAGRSGTVLAGAVFDADKPAALTGKSLKLGADKDGIRIPAHVDLNSDEFTLGYFINLKGTAQGNAGLERLSSRTDNAFETGLGFAVDLKKESFIKSVLIIHVLQKCVLLILRSTINKK